MFRSERALDIVAAVLHSPTKVAYIDALRGYAILGVIAMDAATFVPWPTPLLQQLASFGERSIQLFFIASALTVCMSWRARQPHEAKPVSSFYLRRAFRIVPLYWLAIAVYVPLLGLGARHWAPNGVHGWAVLLNVFCLHGLHPEAVNAVVPGGWAIAVGMAFYLIFPWLAATLDSVPKQLGLLCFSLLLYVAAQPAAEWLWAAQYPASQRYLVDSLRYVTLPGQLPVFALGLLTFSMLSAPVRWRRAVGGFGVFGYFLAWLVARTDPTWYANVTHPLCASVAFACLALLLSSGPMHALNTRPVIALGRMSYGLYLVHFAVVLGLAKLVSALALPQSDVVCMFFLMTALALSVAVARATYVWLELPAIALGARIIERRNHD